MEHILYKSLSKSGLKRCQSESGMQKYPEEEIIHLVNAEMGYLVTFIN